jgi:hypothetical protein
MDATANGSPVLEPFLTAGINLDRTLVIAARNMQIHHRDLENAAIQLTDLASFRVPGILEGFVCFKILPGIEQQKPLYSLWRKRGIAGIILVVIRHIDKYGRQRLQSLGAKVRSPCGDNKTFDSACR